MAGPLIFDRVKETTATTGTGTLTLAGAVDGFQAFADVGADADTFYYAIVSGVAWEVGIGTLGDGGTTLARTTILASSNAGAAINLTGTSDVFCTMPAASHPAGGTNFGKDYEGTFDAFTDDQWTAWRQYNANPVEGTITPLHYSILENKGVGAVGTGRVGIKVMVADADTVVNKTVTDATNASPIVITTSTDHGFVDGDRIAIYQVTGNTAANALAYIDVLSATTFAMYTDAARTTPIAGDGAYISGGIATNRPTYYGHLVWVKPELTRDAYLGTSFVNGDDVCCYAGENIGSAKGTDAFYLAASPWIDGNAWAVAYNTDANCQIAYRVGGTIELAAFDATPATITSNVALKMSPGQKLSWADGSEHSNSSLILWGESTDPNPAPIVLTPQVNYSESFRSIVNIQAGITPTAALTWLYGMLFIPTLNGTEGVGTNSVADAPCLFARFDTAADYDSPVVNAYNFYAAGSSHFGGGELTTLYGLYVANPLDRGTTITFHYGIFVAALGVATGNVGARIDACNHQTLWLSGNADNTTAAAGIAFGASRDTNLYRSAANQLKTDNALVIGASSSPITGVLVGSTTFDPANTTNGAAWSTTLTVTGAAVGDMVLVNHSSITGSWIMYGYVSADNTVTVVAENVTGGTVNLGSGTLKVLVIKC